MDRGVARGTTATRGAFLQRKQAGYVTLEFTVTPQFDENRVVEILGIGRDITERKQLEKQLRQAQRMNRSGSSPAE
jgi:PAS domain S-box-containing protein